MSERRAVPRIAPPEGLAARIRAFIPARVVDISPQGVQLEVASCLRVEADCQVRFAVHGKEVTASAVVRRCRAWAFGVGEGGQKVLLFRAGLEFTPEGRAELRRVQGELGLPSIAAGEGAEIAIGAADTSLPRAEASSPPEDLSAEKPSGEEPVRLGPVRVKVDTSRFGGRER